MQQLPDKRALGKKDNKVENIKYDNKLEGQKLPMIIDKVQITQRN
jgi:hypothetical protein